MTVAAETSLHSDVRDFLSRPGRLLIDGQWVDAASGRTFSTGDPATGRVIAEVAHGEAEDVDRAVRAARRAFEEGPWQRMKPNQRERLIWRIGDLLSERAEVFGQLESLDNGKSAGIAQVVGVGGLRTSSATTWSSSRPSRRP
jgi:aldehyde dehydrogenase (NAD+)